MLPYLLAVAGGYLIGNSMKEDAKFAKGGSIDNSDVLKIYKEANKLHQNHISMGGKLDYSEKEFGYLADELEDVEVGYFKDESVDSDYAKQLREEGFTMTEREAYDVLKHRIESIKEELK